MIGGLRQKQAEERACLAAIVTIVDTYKHVPMGIVHPNHRYKHERQKKFLYWGGMMMNRNAAIRSGSGIKFS